MEAVACVLSMAGSGFLRMAHYPQATKLMSLNTAASPPVFRFFGAGKGSMTPASPRREASLFTYPRCITGGFSLLFF